MKAGVVAGLLGAGAATMLALYLWQLPACREWAFHLYGTVTDRREMEALLSSLGAAAPAGFILLQILQVILAPLPGEVSGLIGGYLFGAWPGFCYSTFGLTIGSLINFTIGRYMGKQYIRRRISPKKLKKFDAALKRQGLLVVFFLFLLPGFPKDYLSLFLGVSSLPWKVFLMTAAIGRMPGTLLLSLQGAALYHRMYALFGVVAAATLLLALLTYRYRETLYRWAER